MRISTTPDGEVTYAGIDYHKKFSVITLGDRNGKPLVTRKVINDKRLIKEFLEPYRGLQCAVESCRGYEWFVDYLKELGHTVQLVNAFQAKLITQSRCKTDRIDSRILMELLAKGFLPTCYQPTAEERSVRERIRWRAHVVRLATKMKVRIHSLLAKEGVDTAVDKLFNEKGKEFLSRVELNETRRHLLNEHLSVLDYLEHFVEVENSWIAKEVKSNPGAKLLKTAPGIGDLTALVIVAELGDVSRFRDSSRVAAYAGLVPSIYSSAAKYNTGRITKQGSPLLRWIMVQAAWRAINYSPELKYHFIAVSRRCGKNPAIISVARKLLQIAYRILRDNKPFNAELVGKKPA